MCSHINNSKQTTSSFRIQACSRLHNFIIEQQLKEKAGTDADDDDDEELHIVPHAAAPSGMRYLPTLPQDDYEPIPGNSLPMQLVLEEIRVMKHRRPKRNTLRNNSHPNDPVDSNGRLIEATMYHPT